MEENLPPIMQNVTVSCPFSNSSSNFTSTPTNQPPFKIYTDSQSLITTISELSKWTLHFPSTALQPEWDMLQAITTTLQKLHTRPTLTHVKSNLDDQQDYATLLLQAKLNVNADKLAGD